MMEAAPAPSFVVPEAQFLFQLLIIALDPPAQFGQIDQAIERHVRRNGGQPVFGGLGLTLGPFDQQPFLVPRLGPPLVAVGGPHPNPGKARDQRARTSLAPGNRLPAFRRQAERKRLDAKSLYAKWVRVTGSVPRQSSVRPERGSPCWANAPHQHPEPGGSAFAFCPTPSPRPPG